MKKSYFIFVSFFFFLKRDSFLSLIRQTSNNLIEVFPDKSVNVAFLILLPLILNILLLLLLSTSFTLLLLPRFFPLFDCRYSRVDSESEYSAFSGEFYPLTRKSSPFHIRLALPLFLLLTLKIKDQRRRFNLPMAEWRMIPSPFHSAPCFEKKTCAFWILSCPTSKVLRPVLSIQRDFLLSFNVSWFENDDEINRIATWLSWLEGRTRSVAARDSCNVDFETFRGSRVPRSLKFYE